MKIDLLANHPDLVSVIGEMRWREWGHPPEPEQIEFWLETTAREAGKDALPVTWVAMEDNSAALGAVGLAVSDIEECRDRSPWVIGTIVVADQRSRGIGEQLLRALETWAGEHGYSKLWVGTGGRAVAFYQKCGWLISETLQRTSGEVVTILTRELQEGGL